MKLIQIEFCLHEIMLLDIVKNLEGNERNIILEKMAVKERYLIKNQALDTIKNIVKIFWWTVMFLYVNNVLCVLLA